MRINELKLINFQSHKNSVIALSPGLNVFIGATNEGKSSVVRSLECLLYGEWDSSYVTIGADSSTISAKMEDQSILEKTKGRGINKFSLSTPGGSSEDYSGFGDTLPPHLIQKLGSHPIILDDDKKLFINIAAQHDSIFLLSETGGLRSKIIGYISGIHLIDSVVRDTIAESRNINSMLSDLEIEKSRIVNTLAKYDEKEKEFDIIPDLEAKVKEQEMLAGEIEKLKNILISARNYNAKIQDLKTSMSRLESMDEETIRNKFTEEMIALKQCPFCGSALERSEVSKHLCHV